MTCGAPGLGSCTNDDVVAGLAQLSAQLHGFAAFVMFTAVVIVVIVVVQTALLFVNGMR